MNEKLSILTELIKLARVDKQYRDDEYQFMKIIAKSLSISKEQLDALFNEYVEFSPPEMEMARIVQFQRLVLLANIDMEVANEEMAVIREAGMRLGLRAEAVTRVLKEMKEHERGMVPEDKLLEIFKTYHN